MSTEDLPSSQATNEDPTLPGAEAGEATLILTPDNAEARLAFFEVVEWLHERSDSFETLQAQEHARKYMCVFRNQARDAEVTRLLRALVAGDLSSSSPMSSPQNKSSSRSADVPPEPSLEIWNGCYFLSFSQPPRHPSRGWTAGSLRQGQAVNDLVLCLRPSNDTIYRVRHRQAILQIHSTGPVYIQSMSDRAQCYVNGNRISNEIHVLNEAAMAVTFGNLRYRVEYARFSRTQVYQTRLQQYLQGITGAQVSQSMLALTPTPSETGSITVGQWTLTTGTVGSGATGRVSIGMDPKGKLAALKRMTVDGDRNRVQEMRRKLEALTSLAEKQDEDCLLRFVGMITDDALGVNHTADLWLVLEPVVADTLYSISAKTLLGAGDERLHICRTLLEELLGATHFLHRNGWLHGDIKPNNIGIRTWTHATKSIVLLDLDGAQRNPAPGQQLPAKPGVGGTVGWLSPEREMTGYTEKTDVWGVGVTALWMIQGRHPWNTNLNPWRPDDPASVGIRPLFHTMYEKAVGSLEGMKSTALKQAILGMVRHPYAQQSSQREPRVSAEEALDLLLDQSQQRRKRMKV